MWSTAGSDRFVDQSADHGLAGDVVGSDLSAVDLDSSGDGYDDVILANGGPDPAGLAPDAMLLNQNGKSFSPRLLDCLPPKSLLAVTDNSPGGAPPLFITKGGLVPGEMEEGHLYAVDRK